MLTAIVIVLLILAVALMIHRFLLSGKQKGDPGTESSSTGATNKDSVSNSLPSGQTILEGAAKGLNDAFQQIAEDNKAIREGRLMLVSTHLEMDGYWSVGSPTMTQDQLLAHVKDAVGFSRNEMITVKGLGDTAVVPRDKVVDHLRKRLDELRASKWRHLKIVLIMGENHRLTLELSTRF